MRRLVILILLFTRSAVAQEQRAFLTLVLNEVEKGEVLVVLRASDVLIDVDTLAQAGLDVVAGGRETIGGSQFVSLRSLAPDVQFEFDERTLTLRVTATPALLGSTRRALQAAAPPDLQYLRTPSGFLNYAVNWRGGGEFDLFNETALSIGGALLANTMLAENGEVVRGLTSLTIDDRSRLRRWSAGDIVAAGSPLAGDAFIGGLSVSREFSIQPYFHRYPSLSLTGAVTTPSTLELYVNERLVQTQNLAPGRFELTSLPLASGINDARIVIKDAFGNMREVAESYYLTTTTLAPGLQDYRYSLGFQRRGIGPESSWAYGPPVLLAQHRKGFTNQLTVGGRLELKRDLISGGPIVNARLPFGELEAVAGLSQRHGDRGTAGSLSFTHIGRRTSFGVTMLRAAAQYATVNSTSRLDRPLFQISGFASAQTWGRTSITLQHSQGRMQTGETRGRTSLLVSTTIAPRLLIVANATREAPDGHPRASLFAGLTLSFGAGGTATIGGERAAGQVRSFAEVQRSLPTGAGYGYRLRAEDRDRQLWAGTLEYQNQYGRYEMRRERVGGADHSTIRATGGIVAIGGRLYASRPVQNSFALVRVPDVKGVRAYANRQEVGRTNAKGDLLVPDLLSYYGNLLNISDEDVPFGYEIERIQTTIAPPHRGGALVTFPVRRVQQTVGRVEIDAEGEVTIPAYGTLALMVDGVSITSPIGANGEFYFEDVAPGRHPAMLQHRGRSCAFEVDVPVSHSPVNQLGAITCVDSHTQP